MISKNLLKYVRSLENKKGRKELGLFVAEGTKIVGDMMKVMGPFRIFATEEWWKRGSPPTQFPAASATGNGLLPSSR